ncbi:MAG: Crp/Fnr family transcriptional regulator [Thermanaerothrix sp.]|uniref:Crp/Fnr family transcriptional regulator n=1 Tax=Thermanaerothrix sp. TaxID=2972675 RepID=UPI003C7E7313
MKLADRFASHPFFEPLSEQERAFLAQHALVRRLSREEHLATQGDCWPYLFLILEGEIEAIKISTEGRPLIVTTFVPGDIFWGPAFFEADLPLPVSLEANQPTMVVVWSRSTLEPLLAKGGIGWALARLMLRYMLRANVLLERLAFQPVTARLARLLLEHFQSTEGPAIPRILTLDDMAARIGTTREVACRTLYYLADRKIIDVTRTELVLIDRESLMQLAEGT